MYPDERGADQRRYDRNLHFPNELRNMSADSFPGVGSSSRFHGLHLKIPSFDGKGKWTTFIRQFEAIALNCRWSLEEKLGNLLASLIGEAAEFTFELDEEILKNYDELIYQLDCRFRVLQTQETNQRLFYTRKLQKLEQPRQFAADLRKLIQKAYPRGLSPEVREDMLLKQFFDGLEDEDACYNVKYLQRPRSLDDAVDKLHEYYSFCKVKRDQFYKHKIRMVGEDEDLKFQSVPVNKTEISELCDTVKNLTKIVTQLVDRQQSAQKPNGNKPGQQKREFFCFKCGKHGHYARNCYSKVQEVPKSRPKVAEIVEEQEYSEN